MKQRESWVKQKQHLLRFLSAFILDMIRKWTIVRILIKLSLSLDTQYVSRFHSRCTVSQKRLPNSFIPLHLFLVLSSKLYKKLEKIFQKQYLYQKNLLSTSYQTSILQLFAKFRHVNLSWKLEKASLGIRYNPSLIPYCCPFPATIQYKIFRKTGFLLSPRISGCVVS